MKFQAIFIFLLLFWNCKIGNGFRLPFLFGTNEQGYKPPVNEKFTVSVPQDISHFNVLWSHSIQFSNRAKVADIRKHIQFSPEAQPGESFPPDAELTSYMNLGYWNLSAETDYTITITSFQDENGKTLENPGTYQLKIGRLLPNFRLLEGNNYVHTLESQMKPYIPISFSELNSVDLEYGSFDLKELISMNSISDANKIFQLITHKKVKWNTQGPKKQYYKTSLNLGPYLENKKGFLSIGISAPVINLTEQYNSSTGNYETKEVAENKNARLIVQSTNLALTVREDYLQSYIWATSLSDAKPEANVKIKFYQGGNLTSICETDKEGFCPILKTQKGFEKNSLYYAEKNTEDKSFLLSRFHQIYQYYTDTEAHKIKPSARLFFDRKLYRPGDLVQIKAIVSAREKGELKAYKGSVKIKINDPTGTTVLDIAKTTSQEGGAGFSFQSSPESKLGHYNVILSSSDGLSYSDTFQVEEFRPVSFAVDLIDITKDKSEPKYQITGKYLFGSPMREATVKYSIFRDEGHLYFPDYSKYDFGVYNYSYYYDYDSSGYYTGGDEGPLDENGVYVFSPDIQPQKATIEGANIEYAKYTKYRVQATVKDKDDKAVTKTKSIDVYPGNFLIGVTGVDSYQKYSEKFLFDIVTLDNSGNPVTGKEVELYVVHTKYNSVKEMGVSGYYYNNTIERRLVYDGSLKIKSNPTRFEFKAPEPGSYDLYVKEKNGLSLSSTHFYGYKENYFSAWNFRSDDTVELSADRRSYKIGEKAKILVKSPFPEARAIVTLEREKIFWQKTFDLKGNGTPIEVPILQEHLPNVFVNVMLIRPRMKMPNDLEESEKKEFTKEDLGIPKIKAGRVELKVDISDRTAKLEVSSDKKIYSPGSRVKLIIKTEPNAELGISVADRGVLDLVGYKYNNPAPDFYNSWQHGVRMFDIRDSLIRQLNIEPKGNAPGGDYGDVPGEGGFGFSDEDGSRKNFKYTAFWDSTVYADDSGTREIEFNLPDNLTTFKVMVVAAKNGKYNAKNHEFIVKKPIVVQGILPRFLRVNDKLEMGALVINETGKDVEMNVSFDSNSLQTGTNSKKVKIPKNKSLEVSFPVTIKSEILKSKTLKPGYKFKASITAEPVNFEELLNSGFTKEEIRDKLHFTIPFKESTQVVAFGTSGYSDGEKEFKGEFPSAKNVFNDIGELSVSLSNTALVGLEKGFHFYEANPYMCMEQRTSAYLLAITSGELLKEFAFQPPDKYSYDFKNIDTLFNKEMIDFQNEDGSYRLWKQTDSYGYPYLTSYVAMVMQLARETGHRINAESYKKAINYLMNYPKNPKEELRHDLENFSLIYYVLTKENLDATSLEKTLLDNLNDLSIRGKSYLAMGLAHKNNTDNYKSNSTVKKVFDATLKHFEMKNGKFSLKEDKNFYGYFSYNTNASQMGILLRLLLKLDKENSAIPSIVETALGENSNSYWSESHGTGNLALALREYRNLFEISESDFIGKYSLKGRSLIEEKFPANGVATFNKKFPYGEFKVNEKTSLPFKIEKPDGNGRLYYTALLRYSSTQEIIKSQSNGIKISRSISDDSGSSVSNEFQRGKVYTIELEVEVGNTNSNFIIVDRIPSTMEIVNSSFQTEENRSTEDSAPWYERTKPYIEYRDDKVVIAENYLQSGIHKYKYFIRPLVKGESIFPAGESFFMYHPQINGRSESFKTIVK